MSVPHSVSHEGLPRCIHLLSSFGFFRWLRVVESQHAKSTGRPIEIQIVFLGWVGCRTVGAQNAKVPNSV